MSNFRFTVVRSFVLSFLIMKDNILKYVSNAAVFIKRKHQVEEEDTIFFCN